MTFLEVLHTLFLNFSGLKRLKNLLVFLSYLTFLDPAVLTLNKTVKQDITRGCCIDLAFSQRVSPIFIILLVLLLLFWLLFGFPAASFGSLSRGQCHLLDVVHLRLCQSSTRGLHGVSYRGWIPKPGREPCGV